MPEGWSISCDGAVHIDRVFINVGCGADKMDIKVVREALFFFLFALLVPFVCDIDKHKIAADKIIIIGPLRSSSMSSTSLRTASLARSTSSWSFIVAPSSNERRKKAGRLARPNILFEIGAFGNREQRRSETGKSETGLYSAYPSIRKGTRRSGRQSFAAKKGQPRRLSLRGRFSLLLSFWRMDPKRRLIC